MLKQLQSKEKALKIAELAQQKKAKRIIIMEMKNLTNISDYFVIASGTSTVHIETVRDGIVEGILKERLKPINIEGSKSSSWILIDYGDVIAHIFCQETRDFYRLENLWGDAKRIRPDK